MKIIRNFLAFAALFSAMGAVGSGFGLYQPSAIHHAMGGAVVGRAMDASANFANPATLTDLTNLQFTAGFVTEHPRGDVSVNGRSYDMDPGAFMLPHFMMAAPLPWDLTFGLGISPEYGLGTEYRKGWEMNWSTVKTTVEGIVINPNLAYKITDDWSVGAGIRWLYFSFEQDTVPQANVAPYGYMGQFNHHLKGDNGWKDFSWQIGTKYDITDTLSAGLVYKAAIDEVTVDGHSCTCGPQPVHPVYAPGVDAYRAAVSGDAEADLNLPQSITGGLNWDATEKLHLGMAVSWTQWSEIDTLHFMLNGNDAPKELKWHDTWRGSLGAAYDIFDDWTAMLSYVYDMDCTDKEQKSAMLPPADRHILAGGVTWRCWGGLELTLSYSCIFMDGDSMRMQDSTGRWYKLETQEGFCHAGGFSATYRF